jgi:hypothetical protein
MPSEYEFERERNIARNKALLEQLNLKQAVDDLIPVKTKPVKSQAKPIQSAKTKRPREDTTDGPRRQSARLQKDVVDPNESPSKRKRREVGSVKTIVHVPDSRSCRPKLKSAALGKQRNSWKRRNVIVRPNEHVTQTLTSPPSPRTRRRQILPTSLQRFKPYPRIGGT